MKLTQYIRSTVGAHKVTANVKRFSGEQILREQILNIARKNAIGSEVSAVERGDTFVINGILKRRLRFAS